MNQWIKMVRELNQGAKTEREAGARIFQDLLTIKNPINMEKSLNKQRSYWKTTMGIIKQINVTSKDQTPRTMTKKIELTSSKGFTKTPIVRLS